MSRIANGTPAKFVAALMEPYRPLQRTCREHYVKFDAALDEVIRRASTTSTPPLVLVKALAREIEQGIWP